MTTTELATKYGVPMPETSKELNWDNTRIQWWYDPKYETWKIIQNVIFGDSDIPAPQFHEIWDKLPKEIEYEYGIKFELEISQGRIRYANDSWMDMYNIEIQNNNLAQAAAEMFLMLKKDGKIQ